MRIIYLCFILLTLIVVVTCSEDLWNNYKLKHAKTYRSVLEEKLRYSIFQGNLQKIQEHNEKYNANLVSYKLGINQFTDMTKDELKDLLNLRMYKSLLDGADNGTYFTVPEGANITKEMDWRTVGAVTEVKNQEKCGSCWSFSVTGSIEGQNFIKNGKLISLSEQNLVDCAGGIYGNAGCSGGFLDTAFAYVKDYGLESETEYPYEGVDDTCRYNSSETVVKIKSVVSVEPNNEEALIAAVGLVGPISVAVDAYNWFSYEEGIFDDPECSSVYLNHGVLAVGYGTTTHGQDYWVIKNSWGSTFGESGYIRMKRGNNQCGIALEPLFPIL